MDLEGLLNASLALEKRIATDRKLRGYFSKLWKQNDPKLAPASGKTVDASAAPSAPRRQITLEIPAEMAEMLEFVAQATGKTPAEILEDSFVEYLKGFREPDSSG